MIGRRLPAALLAALGLAGCGEPAPVVAPAPVVSAALLAASSAAAALLPKPPVTVTLLYTSDEHGWLAPPIMTYLVSNVHAGDPALKKDFGLPSFTIVERRGVKIGVIGLATETTLSSAMASRFEGLEIEAEEPALGRAVPEAWAAGADAL